MRDHLLLTSNAETLQELHELPELPALVNTKSGAVFDAREDDWIYWDGTKKNRIHFSVLPPVSAEILLGFKLTLIWYGEYKSASHMENMYTRMLHFLKWMAAGVDCVIEHISAEDIVGYYSDLSANEKWYLGNLRGFLEKWHRLGYPGMTKGVVHGLSRMRLPGNVKGEAVLTMDPEKGPFTEIERQAIHNALENAYAVGKVDRHDYLLASLYMLLGQRSVQYASLKICDVKVVYGDDGASMYAIEMPRAKQRNKLSRSSFKTRPLIPQVGEILIAHAEEVRKHFKSKLPDEFEAPLFPGTRSSNDAPGFEFHPASSALGSKLTQLFSRLKVNSERTGKPIKITARRFRYTIAMIAAGEGQGEQVIAEMLDHNDTQNVTVYTKTSPAILDRIDRAIAMQIAPLAQAFAGTLISNESEAQRGDDPSSRILDPRIDKSLRPMGSCGQFGFCGFVAPIACYTCKNFQPWLDGPHDAVLDYLLERRHQILMVSDVRIASVNDFTIFAVAEVIRRCRKIRKKSDVDPGVQESLRNLYEKISKDQRNAIESEMPALIRDLNAIEAKGENV